MLNCSASLGMSTSVLKALPGKLNIKRHSSSILFVSHVRIILSHCIYQEKERQRLADLEEEQRRQEEWEEEERRRQEQLAREVEEELKVSFFFYKNLL